LLAQFGQERKRLLEESSDLQIRSAEFQIQVERAMREKRAIENELERLKHHYPVEIDRLENVQAELQERMLRHERDRDELQHKLETNQERFSREIDRLEKEKQMLLTEVDVLTRRANQSDYDKQDATDDMRKITKQLADLKEEYSQLQLNRDQLSRDNATALMHLQTKYEAEIADLNNKLKSMSSAYDKQNTEIQQLLQAQQKLGRQWKDESQRSKQKFEQFIEDLAQQIKVTRDQLEATRMDLTRSNQTRDELEQQIQEEKKSHAQLHAILQEAEARAQSASSQVRLLLDREASLISQVKSFQRTIDQMTMEIKRKEPSPLDGALTYHQKILETKMSLRKMTEQSQQQIQ
jgi:chromosome segregation ATPase